MHISERDVSEKHKKCVYPEEDFISNTTMPKPLDVARVKSVKKESEGDVPLRPDEHGPTGWTWSSFSGLRSCGAIAALRSLHTAPFLKASVPQNTFLDTNMPSIPFPTPTKCTYLFENRVFLRPTAWRGSLSCPFLIFHS